eukprot:5645620-Prymnesium_polylepis.1
MRRRLSGTAPRGRKGTCSPRSAPPLAGLQRPKLKSSFYLRVELGIFNCSEVAEYLSELVVLYFEPWRLERLPARSGCVWQASGRLGVWASGRLGHV